jgi:hypothetical protein
MNEGMEQGLILIHSSSGSNKRNAQTVKGIWEGFLEEVTLEMGRVFLEGKMSLRFCSA